VEGHVWCSWRESGTVDVVDVVVVFVCDAEVQVRAGVEDIVRFRRVLGAFSSRDGMREYKLWVGEDSWEPREGVGGAMAWRAFSSASMSMWESWLRLGER